VTSIHNDTWFLSLPPCSARVPCGTGEHAVRWESGEFRLPSHPDGESELVLAALGGEVAGCVELARTWGRHTDDLTMLQIGPREPADHIAIGWNDVPKPGQAAHAGWIAMSGPVVPGGPVMPGGLAARFPRPVRGPRDPMQAELRKARERTAGRLALLALGPAFQFRLAGHVAAAYAHRLPGQNRPALHAALHGRVAPVIEAWTGIDPGQVRGSLHDGDGWGSVSLTGKGGGRMLLACLPAAWLASVWACGLALVARHLVVAVTRPGWPDAQVLALAAPGRDPVLLEVHGTEGSGALPRWEA
jgi:hypothetical protein